MVSSRGTVSSILQRTGQGRLYKPGAKKGLIAIYGATGTCDGWFNLDQLGYPTGEMGRVVDAGWPVASCDIGDLWGNSTMRARMSTLRTNAQTSLFASGKVHLLGVSAGGLSCLNWAKNNPTLVQSISLLIPVINVQGVRSEDRGGFASVVTTAYGGAPPDADNPADYAADLNGVCPIQLFYSTTDPITTEAESLAFASSAGASAYSMGAQGHFWASPWSGTALRDFIRAND